jgi:phenylacetate-coenzyme A ligase PaaK-like adenylate-forming protein
MTMPGEWKHKVFTTRTGEIGSLALEVFRFQAGNNPVYRDFLGALGVHPPSVKTIEQLPFLPVGLFKTHQIKTGTFEPVTVFESSGTTGSVPSRHFVKDISLYEESFGKGFEAFYGPPRGTCIIGLLPSYLERKNSSLVYMVNRLIHQSEHPQSGFYLDEWDKLMTVLPELEKQGQRTLLIGVSFALLDFAEKYSSGNPGVPLDHITIMETGGMKGRREEITRDQLHQALKKAFGVKTIHSEYGMTELLSQAYSKGDGIFQCPPWMKVLIREEDDPITVYSPISSIEQPTSSIRHRVPNAVSGAINIIDLANIHSCSFIATDDVGKLYPDGKFEVLGRMDGSDLRGCSLMVADEL